MAFSIKNGNRRRSATALAEINIVPLVDVVMVLLVIFMLTAHVMEYGLEVEVPKVKTVSESVKELPVVGMSKTGDLMLNDRKISNLVLLPGEVKKRFPTATEVYLRADGQVTWDTLAQIVAELGEAKLKVNMVTQQDELGRPLHKKR